MKAETSGTVSLCVQESLFVSPARHEHPPAAETIANIASVLDASERRAHRDTMRRNLSPGRFVKLRAERVGTWHEILAVSPGLGTSPTVTIAAWDPLGRSALARPIEVDDIDRISVDPARTPEVVVRVERKLGVDDKVLGLQCPSD